MVFTVVGIHNRITLNGKLRQNYSRTPQFTALLQVVVVLVLKLLLLLLLPSLSHNIVLVQPEASNLRSRLSGLNIGLDV